jgi:hypothetical protein
MNHRWDTDVPRPGPALSELLFQLGMDVQDHRSWVCGDGELGDPQEAPTLAVVMEGFPEEEEHKENEAGEQPLPDQEPEGGAGQACRPQMPFLGTHVR